MGMPTIADADVETAASRRGGLHSMTMPRLNVAALLVLLIASAWFITKHTALAQTPEPTTTSDRAALVALYHATDGDSWSNSTNWLSDRPIGDWHGVTTDATGKVVDLDLSSNGLLGRLPSELGNLSELEVLDLHENLFSGPIPTTLASLSSLQVLDLNQNNLNGRIPAVLGNLSSLVALWLYSNLLVGQIPGELGDLPHLQSLILFENRLSGQIPPELGNLTSLKTLSLASNQLTGQVPPELGHLSSLEELSLGNNVLTGSVPPELGNLSNLIYLRLQNTQLTGCIPEGLKQVTSNDFDRVGLPFCDELVAPKSMPTPDAFDEALNSLMVVTPTRRPTPLPATPVQLQRLATPTPPAGPTVSSALVPTHTRMSSPTSPPKVQRGFFTNSLPSQGDVDAELPFDILDPVTLSLIGVLVTLGATAIQLFRGR